MSEQPTTPQTSKEVKLNSVQALAEIYNVDANVINEAEEKGTLKDLQAKYANEYKSYSLQEQLDHKKNIIENYETSILSQPNGIPPKIYNHVKGTVLEQKERALKQIYGLEATDYKDFDELIDKIVISKSKDPSESKKEDLDKISKLTAQIENTQNVAQQNLKFQNQILQHEEILAAEMDKQKNIYETYILQNIVKRQIDKIPFQDNDSPEYLEYVKTGFREKFNNKIEIRLNEKLQPEAFDKETKARIENKVGAAKPISDVFSDYIKQNKISLKIIKQGADIHSLTSKEGGIQNMADAQKYIKENGITNISEMQKIYAKIPVKK